MNDNTIIGPTALKDIPKDPSMRNLIEPVEKSLKELINFDLKLITIRKISNERHRSAHHNIKSVLEQ